MNDFFNDVCKQHCSKIKYLSQAVDGEKCKWLVLSLFLLCAKLCIYNVAGDSYRPAAEIPQCTSSISQNAPFCNRNVHICAHFCYKVVHCWILVWSHDDVIKWKHFPRYWPFVRGIHWSPVNSLHKGQWRGALMFSLICTRINFWVNNGEAGDLRRLWDGSIAGNMSLSLPCLKWWVLCALMGT